MRPERETASKLGLSEKNTVLKGRPCRRLERSRAPCGVLERTHAASPIKLLLLRKTSWTPEMHAVRLGRDIYCIDSRVSTRVVADVHFCNGTAGK